MQAIILSVGDELVLGQTIDTNSAWLSQQLAEVGCEVIQHVTVADHQPAIEDAIRSAIGNADLLVISGGIGPTADDLTRQALASALDVELEMNPVWLIHLIDFFKSRGRDMPDINKVQAMIPRGARMLENPAGTAAGIAVTLPLFPSGPNPPSVPRASDEYMERMFGKVPARSMSLTETIEKMTAHRPLSIFVLPGVPKEMRVMFNLHVLMHVVNQGGRSFILSSTLHTFGVGESAIAEKLGNLMRRDRNPSVGTTVSGGVVSLRINSRFTSIDEAEKQLEATEAACREALGDLIYGQDEQTLAEVVAQMLLKSPGITVTTAESCTGGLVAKMLTDTPGSSAYFKRGWVTYANEAKTELLGVSPELLADYGAVSEQVVRAMAIGARERAQATFALSISGIAGPDGGTPDKPVGTVWFALAHIDGCEVRKFILTGDREMIRDRAAKMALTMLRFHLLKKSLPF